MDIIGVIEGVCEALQAEGIDARVDPRDLNPPCAWVAARELVPGTTFCGGGELEVEVYLIGSDAGATEAVSQLTQMLSQALEAVTPDGPVSLSEGITLPSGGGPMPSFLITLKIPL